MLIPNFLAAVLNILPDIFGRQRLNMYAQLLMLLFELAVCSSASPASISISSSHFIFFVSQWDRLTVLLLRLVGRYEATL